MNWRKNPLLALLLVASLLLPQAGPVVAQPAATYTVSLPRVAFLALEAAPITPLMTLDYGAFAWVELSAADLARLQAAGLPYQLQPEAYTLDLGGQRFDPRQAVPALPAALQSASAGPDLRLMQFAGPIRPEWLAVLEAAGLQPVQYIHPFAYVLWGERAALQNAAANRFVRWSGDFAPAYRLLPQWRDLPADPVRVDVILYRGADGDAVIEAMIALGGQFTGRTVMDAAFEIAGFQLPGTRFQEAVNLPGVYSLQVKATDGGPRGEMSNQINVGNYNASNQAFPGYLAWLDAAGVHGTGVRMANVDGGVDQSHADLVNRIVSCTGQTCGGSAIDDHGTHTAGIMAADGSSGVTDAYGFLRGLGMAPEAQLVEQVYSPWYTQPGGVLLLMTESQRNGAVLSSNSWGPASTPQGYDDDTRQVDVGVRDADPVAAGNQPFNYVLSIMNGNGGVSSQGTPDEAKNAFTIGSTKMQTGGGAQILQIDDISSNSAHGPALDGRKIPHMVAPGCSVDSTVPGGYDLMCGTSMSSPHVSGAVALFYEYYRALFGVDPSPALVKATFLPVAHDLSGHLDADGNVMGHPFDSKQGWGRMNVAEVVSPTVEVQYYDNPLVFGQSGEEWAHPIAAADPSKPVRLMLVWSDAPGHGLGGSTPAWVNNLDLVVEVGGVTYRGNAFTAAGWSQPGATTADGSNNTEGVFLPAGALSAGLLRVVAANIAGDGIPNNGDLTDQDFALVCYNCAGRPDFALEVAPAQQSACAQQPAAFSVEVASLVGYDAPVTLSAYGYPAGGQAAFGPNPVIPPGTSIFTVTSPVTASWGTYSIDIIGAAITSVHTATVGLELFTALPDVALAAPPDNSSGVGVRPAFTWAADQGKTYDIQVATDPAFTDLVASAAGLTVSTFTPAVDLEHNTIYYWRVTAHNACGEAVSASARFLTVPAIGQCSLGAVPNSLYTQGFENGDGGWNGDGLGNTWALQTVRKHTGAYAFKAAEPATVSDQWLTSPQIAIPADQHDVILDFWNYRKLQSGCADGGILEISTDNGATWMQLDDEILVGGYTGQISSVTNPLNGKQAWCNSPSSWTNVVVSLNAYIGETITLRYRLGTDNAVAVEGWYLDDVSVESCTPLAALGDDSQQQVMAGESVTYTFTLANDGPADVFDLELSGNAWPAEIVGAEAITLTQGMSATIQVRVDVPMGAAGDDTFTLRAVSHNIPGLWVSVTGQTTALVPWRIFLPVTNK